MPWLLVQVYVPTCWVPRSTCHAGGLREICILVSLYITTSSQTAQRASMAYYTLTKGLLFLSIVCLVYNTTLL